MIPESTIKIIIDNPFLHILLFQYIQYTFSIMLFYHRTFFSGNFLDVEAGSLLDATLTLFRAVLLLGKEEAESLELHDPDDPLV